MRLTHYYIYMAIMLVAAPLRSVGRNVIFDSNVKTLQVVAGNDWLSPPVLTLGGEERLKVSFDELSHEYHRYVYHIDHCEEDWTPSEGLFESDFLVGFNDNPIDNCQSSINTTVDYTHYTLTLPNDRCRLKLSGNYRLTVFDEADDNRKVLEAEFRVLEQQMRVGMSVTTNTDIDVNRSHQQVSISLDYGDINVTNLEEQLRIVVTQNGRDYLQRELPRPTYITPRSLRWEHCRDLIFDGDNEYRKFEMLDVSHPTMGIDRVEWDGSHYNFFPFLAEPRRFYLYDEDADGAFYIRNSDNVENDYTTDYVFVHYILKTDRVEGVDLFVDGHWTTDADRSTYNMTYDEAEGAYFATLMQKQGYYSYQYRTRDADGREGIAPSEGSFYETENRYQAYVYYRGVSDRTWRLVGYRQAIVKL